MLNRVIILHSIVFPIVQWILDLCIDENLFSFVCDDLFEVLWICEGKLSVFVHQILQDISNAVIQRIKIWRMRRPVISSYEATSIL